MTQDYENIAETNWREGFRDRIIQARGNRTQQDMADLLGITQSAYSKYEGKRMSSMPTRLLPKFCKICAVSLEWLIEGKTQAEAAQRPPKAQEKARRRA